MSKRRTPGEIVVKAEGAGFVGVALRCRIEPDAEEDVYGVEYCMMGCGDPDCREWVTLTILDEQDEPAGECYHVSECQMQDAGGRVTI